MPIARTTCKKHLDEKLSLYDHINAKISKENRRIGIIKRVSNTLPRNSILNICKSVKSRPHLDNCDIIYDQPNNESFCTKIERIQFNAALAITGAVKGASQTKLYKKLGFKSLKFRRWFRRLCTFFKVKTSSKLECLLILIPKGHHSYNTQSLDQIGTYYRRTGTLKNSFFPYTVVEWNKFDLEIRKSKSDAIFRNVLLKIGRPTQCSVYRIHNPTRLKLFPRLSLGLSHLSEHRFNHDFQSCINPLRSRSLQLNQANIFYCTTIISQIFAQLS